MKFQPKDLHGYERWQLSLMLFFYYLEVIIYLHRDKQDKKHFLSAIDLNISLSNKYRKLVLFLQQVQQEKINVFSIISV